MSRPITVTVYGRRTTMKTPPNAAYLPKLAKAMRFAECRAVTVVHRGEVVLFGGLWLGLGKLDDSGQRYANPWALVDMLGECDFDQVIVGAKRGGATVPKLRFVFSVKNRYWLMWLRYLLHRRATGHHGSYESCMGALSSSVKGRCANIYGWANSLARKLTPAQSQAILKSDLDAAVTEQEAQKILDDLDDGTGWDPKAMQINF